MRSPWLTIKSWWPLLSAPTGALTGRWCGELAAYYGTLQLYANRSGYPNLDQFKTYWETLRGNETLPSALGDLNNMGFTPWTYALVRARDVGGFAAIAGAITGFVLSVQIAKRASKPVYFWSSPFIGALAGAVVTAGICYCNT